MILVVQSLTCDLSGLPDLLAASTYDEETIIHSIIYAVSIVSFLILSAPVVLGQGRFFNNKRGTITAAKKFRAIKKIQLTAKTVELIIDDRYTMTEVHSVSTWKYFLSLESL